MFVTDLIGDSYKEWQIGDKVIVSSPTGSGKSTFILRSLLPYAMEQGMHIVYVCNRKILNDQFAVESRKQLESILGTAELTEEEVQSIHITTYQRCETERSFPHFTIPPDMSGMSRDDRLFAETFNTLPGTSLSPKNILYYVFDESHYFLADALFNPNTNYWYGKKYEDTISIFLTATPEPLMCFLRSLRTDLYNELGIAREISDRYMERQKLRHSLSHPKKIFLKWNEEAGKNDVRIKPEKQSEINRRCRAINPYECAFQFINQALDRDAIYQLGVRNYPQSIDYSYIHTKYFNSFHDLIGLITESRDRWLVFVSTENDGIDLAARLSERGTTVAYLSSQTRHQKDSDGYREFHNIVENQRFECRVLIATSVMDCGVSIKDPKLKHIVIDQSDKTEFLQMLGRRRVDPNETINLYIKYLSPKSIDSMRARCEKKLYFMVNLYRINELSYDRKRIPTSIDDGMQTRSELTADTINKTVKELVQNPTLVYNKEPVARADYPSTESYVNPCYNKSSTAILREYQMSTTAFIQILYVLKRYLDTLEIYREEQDPVFYLKEQLSWLSATYDVQNWVGYGDRMKELTDFLGGYCSSGVKIIPNQQQTFREECLKLLLALPMPIKAMRKDISRYQKGTLPGAKKLNDIFAEIGVPYRIRPKQGSSKDNRKTIWYIVTR